jgi:hypothetical protein
MPVKGSFTGGLKYRFAPKSLPFAGSKVLVIYRISDPWFCSGET